MGITARGRKQEIAIGIALQTQVLKTCPIHNQLYCGDEEQCADDENMARAFAVAIELVHQHAPYAEEFHNDAHELTDLLSSTIGAAPQSCPDCMPQQSLHLSSEQKGIPAAV
ncbi:MAG TPA: hypothetical protein VGO37_13880 [Steroidobacteraceae bacterium]|nr:hypothetical protein [Steroidobacteraceae bacterium]